MNGVAGASSFDFANLADEFFPAGNANAKYSYAYKIARHKASPNENCVVIAKSMGNPNGKAYGVDNDKDAFVAFRSYVERQRFVGPHWYELVWDKAILFTCVGCHRSHLPLVAVDRQSP